ncbi:hypothetical protein QTG54_012586 [Skeletonema marinoi]|uniref:Uncharacterized protein n=1 Tax=Skeletonema marinoi TaxID=267567 RepID=A0AAD8XZN2_9STRA|nr:hypothetical protein QTG54_012586 [Skeletonema marinoi]
MVFFNSSDPAEMEREAAADEEPASLACSCMTPRRWKKGGEDNNELSDIVVSFDDKDDNRNAEAGPKEEEEEVREAEEKTDKVEFEKVADSNDGTPTSEETCVGADNTEDNEVAQDGDDGDEKEDEGEAPETGEAEEEPAVTFAAEEEDETVLASPTDDDDDEEEEAADEDGELEMPVEEDVAGKSLLKLAKTKPQKKQQTPKKPQTPKRALFDDIPDDESEASIEVLFRYMGCTQEAYGERYQYPTISATMTMETTGSYETSGDNNDLIENIESIESIDDNDDANETANISTNENADDKDDDANETADDNDDDGDDLLRSPSGTLLINNDDDEEEANEPKDIAESIVDEKKELFSKELTSSTPTAEQLDNTTPPDKQPADTTPIDGQGDEKTSSDEQVDENTPMDEQSDDNAPTDAQLDGTVEQLCAVEKNITAEQTSAVAKPEFNRLTVDTKADDSSNIPPPEDSRSAAMDRVVSRMSHSAMSPSVQKIALALHNAPKYPTTDYSDEAQSGDKENSSHSERNDKVVNTEDTPAEEQGEKEGPDTTLKPSGPLSKVEEMDKLIKSTREWLETQKAERQMTERKAMHNITAETVSPKNTSHPALPEMAKLDTSLPEIKSPISKKTPSSSAQPLSPRTLDSLLLSRKTTSSDGRPKRSILEQLEEIRAKQREREPMSPRSP